MTLFARNLEPTALTEQVKSSKRHSYDANRTNMTDKVDIDQLSGIGDEHNFKYRILSVAGIQNIWRTE